MIRAGSMAYAVLICITVAIFCYALLLISGYGKMHQTMLFTYNEVIANNKSVQEYALQKIPALRNNEETIDLFNNGISSRITVKPWGFYEVLCTETVFKKDTVRQFQLIGAHTNNDRLALFLTEFGRALTMEGKAKIYGDAKLPKKGIKMGYINSDSYRDPNFVVGRKSVAPTALPKINTDVLAYQNSERAEVFLDKLRDTAGYVRGFDQKPLWVYAEKTVVQGKKLSGHIVLESKDSLYIAKNNVLQDIIIKAPQVVFEEGFRGNVQVMATELVCVQEDAILAYPSSVVVYKGKEDQKVIDIKKRAQVLGAAVIYNTNIGLNKIITIEEEARVVGDVYCNGKVQLKGNVTGTVYTHNFYLRTTASAYDNYILDGIIDRPTLPENFVRVPLLKDTDNQQNRYAILKTL